jgi:hypothetical protein
MIRHVQGRFSLCRAYGGHAAGQTGAFRRHVEVERKMLSRTQETTLAAVVESFAPDDADAAATRALVTAAVDGLPPHKRRSCFSS